MSAQTTTFTRSELQWSALLAVVIELGFFGLLVLAGANRAALETPAPPVESARPIAVTPVLDDLPLLKLGGKRVRAKLPDMWKKNPPVQRMQQASAPSPKAKQTPDAIPSTPLVRPDAKAPLPDAEVAKQVDQELLDAAPPDATPNTEGEGSPDGVKEGTEADPLKARVVSQYSLKIAAWFNARFRQPDVECDVLKGLRASVSVSVAADRSVAGYSVVRPSGNATFDERVRATLDAARGQQLPPPPPLYPDILGSQISTAFVGQCD